MSESADHEAALETPGELGELCARATELVRRIPGPMRKMVLRNGDYGVEIEWAFAGEAEAVAATVMSAQPLASTPPATWSVHAPADAEPAAEEAHVVHAPLVGTFYAAPQPGADPFVAVGDVVEPGQTLGIVEAMKLMNHIAAETAGRVVEILVGNGEAVEFQQPLMRIAALVSGEVT